MSDQIEQSETSQATEVSAQEETPAVQPSATDPNLEAVIGRLEEALKPILDKRFSGFQSSFDRKYGKLPDIVAQLQNATLTPEERDEQEKVNERSELDTLRMENQLLKLRADHPEAVDLITGAMGTTSLEEQIAFIESKLGKQVVAQVEKAAEAADEAKGAGEIDPNNPAAKPKMGSEAAKYATVDSDEVADAILNAAPKGALARLRSSIG